MTNPGHHDLEVEGREPGDIAMLRCAGKNYRHAVELNRTNERILDVPYNYRHFYQLSIHVIPGDKSLDSTKCHLVVKVRKW